MTPDEPEQVEAAHDAVDCIHVVGVRVHNLKNISVKIRHNALTVICGVSGSGKSSLAFDTLYAEGQRRYVETFSPYARQFLDRIERPDADRIDGIPPAIAIRQNARGYGRRSTVGTRSEILDYLRLLFAAAGDVVCPDCGIPVKSFTPETAARHLLNSSPGERTMLAFHPPLPDEATSMADVAASLIQRGYTRAIQSNATCRLEDIDAAVVPPDELLIVADRIRVDADSLPRIAETFEQITALGCDEWIALVAAKNAPVDGELLIVDGKSWRRMVMARQRTCDVCGRSFPESTAELINTDAAAIRLEDHTILDATAMEATELQTWLAGLSPLAAVQVRESAAHSLQVIQRQLEQRLSFLIDSGIGYLSLDRPLATLSGGEAQRVALTSAFGSGLIHTLYVLDEPTSGLHDSDTQKIIAATRRLQRLGNTVIVVEHDPAFISAADEVIEIGPDAGRDGGEVVFQGTPAELLLADTATGRAFAGRSLAGRSAGADASARNSNESTFRNAGEPSSPDRVPAQWLNVRNVNCHNVRNLDVDIPLQVVCAVTGVSGSGKSSLLVDALYPHVARSLGQESDSSPDAAIESVSGLQFIRQIELLDQTALKTSGRSVPATYTGAFDDVRRLLAETHEAKKRNYKPGTFSFNSARGGRCESCEGLGCVTVEMQFLADIEATCEMCGGRRFRPDVLEVRYRDRSVFDILEMTADDAFSFFNGHHRIQHRLNSLRQAGLGYIRLGQPISTLSGGECQRLRIATLLSNGGGGADRNAGRDDPKGGGATPSGSLGTLFILDEPSTALHRQDVDRLMACLNHLVQVGHSVVVVEHDQYLVSRADYVIELGPGPGRHGGRVVHTGPQR